MKVTQRRLNGLFALALLRKSGRINAERKWCLKLGISAGTDESQESYYRRAWCLARESKISPKLDLILAARLATLVPDQEPGIKCVVELYDALSSKYTLSVHFLDELAGLFGQFANSDEVSETAPGALRSRQVALLSRVVSLTPNGSHAYLAAQQKLLQAMKKTEDRFGTMVLEADINPELVPSSRQHRDRQPPVVELPFVYEFLTGNKDMGTLFYPGAFKDWSPLDVFATTCNRFILIDYFISKADARQFLLDLPRFVNRSIQELVSIQELGPDDFGVANWQAFWQEGPNKGFGMHWGMMSPDSDSFVLKAQLHNPNGNLSEVYYFRTEAIKTFEVLCDFGMKPGVIVCQDHGLGGQWTNFSGFSLLYAAAVRHNALPKYLYLDTSQRHSPWPGYEKQVSQPQIDYGQMHKFPRALFELGTQDTQLNLNLKYADLYEFAWQGNQNLAAIRKDFIDRYLALIRETWESGPILEVYCGTSRLAFAAKEVKLYGHTFSETFVGIDPDADAIRVLNQKAHLHSMKLDLRIDRLEYFRCRKEDPPFGLALLLLNTVAHLLTRESLLRAVDNLWRALADSGCVLIDFPVEAVGAAHREFPLYGDARRSTTVSADEIDHRFHHYADTVSLTIAGELEQFTQTHILRQWLREEVIETFEARGFRLESTTRVVSSSDCLRFRKP